MIRRLTLAFAVTTGTAAAALTLKEQKQMKAWTEDLNSGTDGYYELVGRTCGYKIPVTLEDKFATPFMAANSSASGYCASVAGAIWHLCEDETSKASVKRSIKKIDCKLGKEKEVSLKLSGGILTATIGINAANISDVTKEWLENNLK